MTRRITNVLAVALLAALLSIANAQPLPDTMTFQERQCAKQGWQVLVLDIAGLQRRVLWKGPPGLWSRGAIVVMHGGGGHHFQFCVANARIVAPQVRFTELALA